MIGFKTKKIQFFYLSFSYLKTSFPDFKFHIIFLRFACVHAIKVFFANLLQLILRSIVDIFRQATSLVNHLPSLGSLPLLLFLQFLGGFFPQKKPQFLLPLRGHEALLGLLARGLGLQPGSDLGLLPLNLCLLLVVTHGVGLSLPGYLKKAVRLVWSQP